MKLLKPNRSYVVYAIGESFQVVAVAAILVWWFQFAPDDTVNDLGNFVRTPEFSIGSLSEKQIGQQESTGIVKRAIPPALTKSLR